MSTSRAIYSLFYALFLLSPVYPKAKIQLYIDHLIKNSMKYISWKDRKILAADLKKIYSVKTSQETGAPLDEFSQKWNHKFGNHFSKVYFSS